MPVTVPDGDVGQLHRVADDEVGDVVELGGQLEVALGRARGAERAAGPRRGRRPRAGAAATSGGAAHGHWTPGSGTHGGCRLEAEGIEQRAQHLGGERRQVDALDEHAELGVVGADQAAGVGGEGLDEDGQRLDVGPGGPAGAGELGQVLGQVLLVGGHQLVAVGGQVAEPADQGLDLLALVGQDAGGLGEAVQHPAQLLVPGAEGRGQLVEVRRRRPRGRRPPGPRAGSGRRPRSRASFRASPRPSSASAPSVDQAGHLVGVEVAGQVGEGLQGLVGLGGDRGALDRGSTSPSWARSSPGCHAGWSTTLRSPMSDSGTTAASTSAGTGMSPSTSISTRTRSPSGTTSRIVAGVEAHDLHARLGVEGHGPLEVARSGGSPPAPPPPPPSTEQPPATRAATSAPGRRRSAQRRRALMASGSRRGPAAGRSRPACR